MSYSRHLKIFISSTFNDMHDERQKLISNVFIKFRKLAKQRGVEVTEIELRTGVTDATGHIAKVCLEQVDRCIDSPIFFLGMLGSSYGWDKWYEVEEKKSLKDEHRTIIDKYPNISLTELEIRYAIDNLTHNQALFYVTEPIEDEDIRLVVLKEELKGYAKERDNLGFDYYENDEEFAQKVYSDLEIALNKIYPENQKLSEVEKLRVSHEAFALSRYKGYVRYEENEKILDEFLSSNNHDDRLLLYGKSGYGKSALVANYFKNFSKESDAFVIEHYIGGAGDASSDFYAMLRRIMLEIKEEFVIEEDVPTEPEEIINGFGVWLQKVKRQTVVVLDGYNQIEDEVKERFLKFYLSVKFEKIKLLVTAIKSDYKIDNKQEIVKLNREKQKELVLKYLGIYGKKLTYDVDELLKHDMIGNTLFLRTLLEEIRLLGVYESIGTDISEYLKAKDVKELFVKIFRRYERDYDAVLTREVLSLLYNSRDGLSQNSMLEILEQKREVDRYKFYPIVLALEEHLVSHSGLYQFFHNYIKKAVESRYLANDELKNHYKKELVEYFEKQEINNQRVRELPYLLFELEDRDKLYRALIDVEFFVAVQEMDAHELVHYLKYIDTKFNIANTIMKSCLVENYTNHNNINKIAYFFHHIYNKYQESLALFKKSTKQREKDLGKGHLDVAKSMDNIASLYETMGDYINAELYYNKAISISEKVLGKDDSNTITIINNLAGVYYFQGKYIEAISTYKESLSVLELSLGENHPSTTANYNNLGVLYRTIKEYDKSYEYLSKTLEIRMKFLGIKHLDTAISMTNLAAFYRAKKENKKALSYYIKSFKITNNILGKYSPKTAIVLSGLAGGYKSIKKYKTALFFYNKSLELLESSLGEKHLQTIALINNLAGLYYFMGNTNQALDLFKRALSLNIEVFENNNPRTVQTYNNMGLIYMKLEQHKEAYVCYENILEANTLNKVNPAILAKSYNSLSLVSYKLQNYKSAYTYLSKAIEIWEKNFSDNYPELVGARESLKMVEKEL